LKNKLEAAIEAVVEEDYLLALNLFAEVYSDQETTTLTLANAARGLSYYGLCLALVERKFKPAIDLCKRAIEQQFYSGEHYANLARVYLAAGNRKKAHEALAAGLKHEPEHPMLEDARKAIGIRAPAPVPFLDRSHPINVTLGQTLHAKKIAKAKKKRK
jgi:tetratricopeptide (TPR) repeat protein